MGAYVTSRELSPELKSILADLDSADERARRIVGEVSDAQANWQPRKSAWSIAQCLDHLSRTNAAYATALRTALSDAKPVGYGFSGPIAPGWFSRWFIGSLEPPPKKKMRSPKTIIPALHANKDDVLQSFLRSQNDVRSVVHQGASYDLNRLRFRNPFVGAVRFTVGAGLLVVAAHDRRHLWQAEQVRNSAGYPRD